MFVSQPQHLKPFALKLFPVLAFAIFTNGAESADFTSSVELQEPMPTTEVSQEAGSVDTVAEKSAEPLEPLTQIDMEVEGENASESHSSDAFHNSEIDAAFEQARYGEYDNPEKAENDPFLQVANPNPPNMRWVCIADNVSSDYANCESHTTEAICHQNNLEVTRGTNRRCEWNEGRCRPWTYGACERRQRDAPAGASTRIYYTSEFLANRPAQRIYTVDFGGGFRQVEVRYQGHGPSLQAFANIVDEAVRANENNEDLRSLAIYTHGCSTFDNLADAEEMASHRPPIGNQRFMERLIRGDIAFHVIGNQMHSRATSLRNPNRPMQYWASIQISGVRRDAPFFHFLGTSRREDFYTCRSALDLSPLNPERFCFEHDVLGREPTCRLGRVWAQETCAVQHLKAETSAGIFGRGFSRTKTALVPAVGRLNIPASRLSRVRRSYAQAQAYCESLNTDDMRSAPELFRRLFRLPTYGEAKVWVESGNKYFEFDTNWLDIRLSRPIIVEGYLWTSQPYPAEAPSHSVYSLDELELDAAPSGYGPDTSESGYTLCVIDQ